MTKKTGTDGEVTVIKKRGGGGKNSPVIGNNGLILEPGDNTKILEVNMALLNFPNIDMKDVEQVQQRLNDYFMLYAQADLKPTVVGMAIALNGHSRQWLWALTHDRPLGGMGNMNTLPPDVTDTIKKAYFLMENQWETYMNSGKINPVSGIFLGKNNFGYQDKTEYVVTPNVQQDNDYNADDIRSRYLIDSENDSESEND
jgi:hypothetical protein